MHLRTAVCSLAIAFASCMSASAPAQTVRCGSGFVNYGESISSVLAKCGAPTSKYTYCKPESRSRSCEKVEEWSFNRPGEFQQIVKFESGAVVSIASGDIVRKP